MTRFINALAPLTLLLVLLLGWELACRLMQVPAYFLPPPSAVARAVAEDLPALVLASWNTLSVAMVALVLASLSAQAIALIVGLSPLLERAVRPLASALQVTPVVAIAPLVLIWAGIDHPERAVIGNLAVIPAAVSPELQDRDIAIVFLLGRAHRRIDMASVATLVGTDL